MKDPDLTVRRVKFEFPPETNPVWNKRFPEFSHGTNSVSMLMPHAEPYFVRTAQRALPLLEDDDLRHRTEDFIKQESLHFRQHRVFNDIIVEHYPGIAKLERLIKFAYGRLEKKRSLKFSVAFVAGSEAIAYALARWTDDHLGTMFQDADPVPSTLYLWHLAEEVEHKTCAYDVFEALDGSRLRYALGMTVSFLLLVFFCLSAVTIMLWKDRRLFHPVSIWRLLRWAFSLSFSVMPVMAASAMPRHDPRSMADPPYLSAWLAQFDPETQTMPLWGAPDRRTAPTAA